jgi:hypothetical protein
LYTELMSSKVRRPLRIALVLLLLLIGGILFLELGSRLYYADGKDLFALPPAAVCDPAQYPPDLARLAALEDLLDVRHQGRRITPQELEDVLVEAPQEDMPGMNGVFCSGMVIVSKRLSPSARLYVARHELEHYFQMEGLDGGCQDWELCATWGAAREYPWGFITTISSSLWESARSTSIWNFLFGSWEIFKVYLLP